MTARSFQSRWIALPLVVLAAVAGTPERATFSALAAPAFVQNSSGTLTVGGRTRTYEVHLPSAYVGKTALPIVFVLHGGGGTGRGMIALTHFDALADRHSFIGVYPDGVQRGWADARGGTVAERAGVDDVGFIAMLIEKFVTEFTVDTRRVYATGISNGGFIRFYGAETPPFRAGEEAPLSFAKCFIVPPTPRRNLQSVVGRDGRKRVAVGPLLPFAQRPEISDVPRTVGLQRWIRHNAPMR